MGKILAIKRRYSQAIRVGWFLAVEQIKHSGKGTTSLIIFIMTLTLLNLIVVSGLLLGLITGSFEQYRQGYSGEVIITSAPGRSYIENSQPLLAYIRSLPDVTSVSPRYGVGATIRGTLSENPKKHERPNQIAIRLVGINPETEEATTRFSRFILHGQSLDPHTSGQILIGATMIQKYSTYADANIPGLDFLKKVDVGSRVRVNLNIEGAPTTSKEFIVAGIVKSKIDEVSTRAFIIDDELKRLLSINTTQYQEIAIRTKPEKAAELAEQLKVFMAGSAARIQTSDEAIPSFLRDIESTMGVLGNALSSIALIVASITIFIVIYINAVTKRKYIGIMKGIGISPLAIEISYVFQALFYGLAGSLIGLSITFGLLKPYFDANPINFPFSDGILVATASGAGIRVLILLVVTLLAGYIPAKLIVRKNTLDAILGR